MASFAAAGAGITPVAYAMVSIVKRTRLIVYLMRINQRRVVRVDSGRWRSGGTGNRGQGGVVVLCCRVSASIMLV